MDIGRNDPCHCGSGKKYKKCCMKKVTSLDAIREEELRRIQAELFQFADFHMSPELESVFDKYVGDVESEEEEMLDALINIWSVFSFKDKQRKAMIELFIEQKRKESARPSLIAQLETWVDTAPSISIISEKEQDGLYVVEDVFSKDVKKVKMDAEIENDYEEGAILIGYLLPFGQYFSYFISALSLPAEAGSHFAEYAKDIFAESDFSNAEEFMIFEYPAMMKSLIIPDGNDTNISQMVWANPLHMLAASVLEDTLKQSGITGTDRDLGIRVWNRYSNRIQPVMKKPQIYSAAMHYYLEKHLMEVPSSTQKGVAEQYGISPASLSKAYRQMEEEIEEDVEYILQHVNDEITNLGLDEPGQYEEFDPNWQPEFDKEEAQELIFEAMQSDPKKRLKLAKEALELYPYHPDAYSMLAEAEQDPDKQLQLFKKGMQVGETDLGEDFFKQNKGMFWGLSETRPYMRAKFNYAMMEAAVGQLETAVKQCEELLELNEMDNQGVRYMLFVMYFDLGMNKQAKKLLDRFDESQTAAGAYNQVLIEYALNGITSALIKLMKKAKEINPFVFDYLVGKKKLPRNPNYDQEEAAVYVQGSHYIWSKNPELIKWVAENGK
ncbi:tetratricopeptide repeat protein [Metabacillus idriensis]|uniref:tetratricopeptide repeat protein n=1 Tax=Metabacillus idriensis TaxID=324768 RepID=UPI00174E810B|nr:SEC-C metal-binding domain-containing protein [Metabacillus idriensis]